MYDSSAHLSTDDYLLMVLPGFRRGREICELRLADTTPGKLSTEWSFVYIRIAKQVTGVSILVGRLGEDRQRPDSPVSTWILSRRS